MKWNFTYDDSADINVMIDKTMRILIFDLSKQDFIINIQHLD